MLQLYALTGPFIKISHALAYLKAFTELSGATTVPSLQEYAVLPNKVSPHGFFKALTGPHGHHRGSNVARIRSCWGGMGLRGCGGEEDMG